MKLRDHERIMKQTAERHWNALAKVRSFDGITEAARNLDHASKAGIILQIWKDLDDESRQALLLEVETITDPLTGSLTYRRTAIAA